jgi:ATP-binding cassette subfamily B protein
MGSNRKTVAIFWRETKKYPGRFARSVIFWPIGIAIQDMGLPLIASTAINELVKRTQSGETLTFEMFVPYLVAFVAAGAIGQLIIWATLRNTMQLQATVRQNLQNKAYQWLINHSVHFHANSFSGALVSQASRFANAYVAIFDITLNQGYTAFTRFAVAVIVLMIFQPPIAIALLIWTIIFVWLNIKLAKKRIPYTRRAIAAETTLTAHLADSMSNIGAIKAFAREQDEATAYGIKTNDRRVKTNQSWGMAINNGAVTAAMMITIQFIVLLLSIWGIIHNQIGIGTLLLAQVYVASLMASLWNVASLARGLEQNFSDAAEMADILHQEPDVQDAPDAKPLKPGKGEIHFDHMHFAHADNGSDALFSDFTLRIKPGEKVGLVGESGSGKTTLTKLLLRFNDVDKGAIKIDGQDISKIKQADLRRAIAYVPQEPLLFHRSIHDNIAYGNPSATRAQVARAATLAHADTFIAKLADGYETLVGERGVKLSGGQRQRIAIARAILKNAPILLLDEATSALDSESEKLIQDALKKLMKGRTTIVIAHRLSTIQHMDRIVVLDNGTIIEQGSHAELLKKDGPYANLWTHQSGGFIEE